ncbi:uncharacterized protein Ecym_2126 [Eremothecium cymbalariae DBVPG|uniref:DUF2415 domain-containing protein n=1 Tax=Eremothecium cymbalariae (strain CBS 270.75 / DBVPG 7215 / KCTC 17166 / NRRL Y-17582) TaxID=931890 RepID=G8JNG3_ERECY|nr:Hypothetical protein Ecym_2126 [Eremothecium cymbalariae DBVPG\
MNATRNVWSYRGWTLVVYGCNVRVFLQENLVSGWSFSGGKVRCRFTEDKLYMMICFNKQFRLDIFEVDSRSFTSEPFMTVPFAVSNFEVLWGRGTVLVVDGVSGCLHCLDTQSKRNIGSIQINTVSDETIYVVDDCTFQVFVNKFDGNTVTGDLYFNTYLLEVRDGPRIRLKNSIPLQKSLDNHFVTRLGNVFSVISSCSFSNRSMVQIYVDGSQEPFISQEFSRIIIHDACFLGDHWNMVLATNLSSICIYQPLYSEITETVRLSESESEKNDKLNLHRVHNNNISQKNRSQIDQLETKKSQNTATFPHPSTVSQASAKTQQQPVFGDLDIISCQRREQPNSSACSPKLLKVEQHQIYALLPHHPTVIYKWIRDPASTTTISTRKAEHPPRPLRITLPEPLLALLPGERFFTGSDTCYTTR